MCTVRTGSLCSAVRWSVLDTVKLFCTPRVPRTVILNNDNQMPRCLVSFKYADLWFEFRSGCKCLSAFLVIWWLQVSQGNGP